MLSEDSEVMGSARMAGHARDCAALGAMPDHTGGHAIWSGAGDRSCGKDRVQNESRVNTNQTAFDGLASGKLSLVDEQEGVGAQKSRNAAVIGRVGCKMACQLLFGKNPVEFLSLEESEKSMGGRNVPRSWSLWKHQMTAGD